MIFMVFNFERPNMVGGIHLNYKMVLLAAFIRHKDRGLLLTRRFIAH